MITVDHLTQIYKSGKGIFDVTFDIKKGEVFGFLGPNGAGKTTTIRNMLGFMNATEGSVTILDKDARKHAASLQKSIGYLPGEMAFFDNMTGHEFLAFMTDMRQMKDTHKRDELVERFELDPNGKIKKMSKGMKQKLGIVVAFMHDPEILILDEPTSGLDPLMQHVFMTLVNEEKAAGKTIMMSSHIFEEVELVCDRAGIIKDGKLVAIEDVQSLKAMKKESYHVTASDSDFQTLKDAGLGVERVSEGSFIVTSTKGYQHLFQTLAQCEVTAFEAINQSLEDIFMKYYGRGV